MSKRLTILALVASVSMGFFGGTVTEVQEVEIELVAVGEDVESAHTKRICKTRDERRDLFYSYDYAGRDWHGGYWWVHHIHEPRRWWERLGAMPHLHTTRCTSQQVYNATNSTYAS